MEWAQEDLLMDHHLPDRGDHREEGRREEGHREEAHHTEDKEARIIDTSISHVVLFYNVITM